MRTAIERRRKESLPLTLTLQLTLTLTLTLSLSHRPGSAVAAPRAPAVTTAGIIRSNIHGCFSRLSRYD
jgi:hypothetical protein